jgi:hypothetical protein
MQKIFAACGARKLCGGIWDAGLGRSLRPVQTVDLAPAWPRATAATPSPTAVQLSEIIGAMSYALDLAEGQDCFVALALMPEPAAAA